MAAIEAFSLGLHEEEIIFLHCRIHCPSSHLSYLCVTDLSDTVHLHPLEAFFVSSVNIFYINAKIFHSCLQFFTVQFTIAPSGFQDLSLLHLCKVLPLEVRSHVFLE